MCKSTAAAVLIFPFGDRLHTFKDHVREPEQWIAYDAHRCVLVPASFAYLLLAAFATSSTMRVKIIKNLLQTFPWSKSSVLVQTFSGCALIDCCHLVQVKIFSLFCFLLSLGLPPWIGIIVEGSFDASARHVLKIQDDTIKMKMQPNLAKNMRAQKWQGLENFTYFCIPPLDWSYICAP